MVTIANLGKFYEILKDPYGSIDRWKDYKGYIGYALPHIPEEMIHATGFLPVALLAGDADGKRLMGVSFLPNICCSYMKNLLETSMDKGFEKLEGVVVPVVCDSTRVLSDIWRLEAQFKFYDIFHVPRKIKGANVKEFFRRELSRFQSVLENYTGTPITDEKLKQSIATYNKNKEMLKRLYQFAVEYPSLLSSRELFTVIKCALLMPKEIHTRWVSDLLAELEREKESLSGPDSQFVKLVAVGKLWDPPEVLDMIHNHGGVIVGDNFCLGSLYVEAVVGEVEDPFSALLDSQLKQMSMFAGYICPRKDKEDRLLKVIEKNMAKGVIFFLLKYCELLSYDYPDLRKALEKNNIPSVAIEIDLESMNRERIKTQIEAFLEMQKGGLKCE